MKAKEVSAKKEEELGILTELFLDIDQDRSGDLSKREFLQALNGNEYIQGRLIELDMSPDYLRYKLQSHALPLRLIIYIIK